MYVIKKDGSRQKRDMRQVRKQTKPACASLVNVDPFELEEEVEIMLTEDMTTSTITQALIDTAKHKIDEEHSDYTYVAARLELYRLYHNIKHKYLSKKVSGDVYALVPLSEYIEFGRSKDMFSGWENMFTEDEIVELNDYIDPDRDLMYTHLGIKTALHGYLGKQAGEIVELPQHMHMAVAMWLAQSEADKMYWTKRFYDNQSILEFINATPINGNGRFRDGSTISCLVTTTPDTMDGIFDTYKDVANGSKQGSGWGWDWSLVRSIGSSIAGRPNAAGGKLPFLTIANGISVAVDQLGRRPGAFSVWIKSWDIEVFDFIDSKKKNGESRKLSPDLFQSLVIDDIMMERDIAGVPYTLFDPRDVPQLNETYGDEFRKWYLYYEKEFKQDPSKFNVNTRSVSTNDIFRKIAISYASEGVPFIMFGDTANKAHRYPQLGIIRSSNLCSEILQPTSFTRTAVCNLGSVNLARVNTKEAIYRVVKDGIRALDNTIDQTAYPTEAARLAQQERRSVGLGALGEAEMIANMGIMYGSAKHEEVIDEIYKWIHDAAEEATIELAIEKGSCIIEGRRNAYLLAVAPNSTSGLFAGTSNSFEAVFNRSWTEGNDHGAHIVTAPNINKDNSAFYVPAYDVDQFRNIDLTAIRQKHIDQGLSHVIYVKPDGLRASYIRDLIRHAWKKKLKTVYYVRSKPPKAGVTRVNKIVCSGCEN